MLTTHRNFNIFIVFILTNTICVAMGEAQERVEMTELRAALKAAVGQSKKIKSENSKLREINKNLSSSLMAANAESEEFRKSYSSMRLQMEALGIELITDGKKGVEGKLLKAMNDIRLLEEEKMEISESLIQLSDASLRLIDAVQGQGTFDQMAGSVKSAIDVADKALGIGRSGGAERQTVGTLHDARVISVKKDYGLVVFNVGRQTGARIGMPFRLFRKDRPVGSSIVVDVRDNVSAALVKELIKTEDSPQIGDVASVETTE